ncbi:MAG: hypothetical protein GF329_03940 [Candidatus Lokiarchaeota archaeon]|nr:hypothetical protein [Candidatus Lokiarchaeota archaeon]
MDLTPSEYVNLTIEMMSKLIKVMGDELAKKKKDLEEASGPQEMMQIIMGIMISLRREIGSELLPEGLTDDDMQKYKKEHEDEIKEYLNNNPEVKEKLETLEKEFKEKMSFK